MKIEYDTEVPDRHYRQSACTQKFWEFYRESSHYNMKLSLESVEEAARAQKNLCMAISRNRIFDIVISRRKNVLYVIRQEPAQ